MALSGSFSTNKYSTSSHGTIGLNLSWTATQSVANNTTTIKWTLKSNGSMSTGYNVQAGPVTVTINGTKVLNTTSRFAMYGGGKYKKTGSITVTHNTDGTKSVSMSVKAAIYSASVNCTESKTYTLDKIDRYALITAISDFNDETRPTITYVNPLGTDRVNDIYVRMTWSGGTLNATDWTKVDDNGGTYEFTSTSLPDAAIADMLSACSSSTQLAVNFEIKSTMDGTVYTYTKAGAMKVVNANPIFTNLRYYDGNSAVVLVTEDATKIVQNLSVVHFAAANISAIKGAKLEELKIEIPNLTTVTENYHTESTSSKDNIDITHPSPFNFTENVVAAVKLTDSRGNFTTVNLTIVMLGYAAPTATIDVTRQSNFYDDTNVNVNPNYSSLDSKNEMTIYGWYKLATDPDYDPQTQFTVTNGSATISLDNKFEWNIRIAIKDKISTWIVYDNLYVGVGIPVAFFDKLKKSIGVNCLPKYEKDLEVDGVSVVTKYDTDATERAVGFWFDGRTIYEKSVQLSSAVTVNANAWNNNVYTFDTDRIVVKCEAYYINNDGIINFWGFMGSQSTASDLKKLSLFNSRDASCQVTHIKVYYVYPAT